MQGGENIDENEDGRRKRSGNERNDAGTDLGQTSRTTVYPCACDSLIQSVSSVV